MMDTFTRYQPYDKNEDRSKAGGKQGRKEEDSVRLALKQRHEYFLTFLIHEYDILVFQCPCMQCVSFVKNGVETAMKQEW
jgi:hypothetical protein